MMATVLVNSFGVVLLGLIVYWFWLSRPDAERVGSDAVEIIVDDGVYTPSNIEVRAGQPITLRFVRKDRSPCAAKVIFDKLGIAEELPIDRPHEVELTVDKAGKYPFTCEMKMYQGLLLVKDS
jgi:plastocyanin domain-containing protein